MTFVGTWLGSRTSRGWSFVTAAPTEDGPAPNRLRCEARSFQMSRRCPAEPVLPVNPEPINDAEDGATTRTIATAATATPTSALRPPLPPARRGPPLPRRPRTQCG